MVVQIGGAQAPFTTTTKASKLTPYVDDFWSTAARDRADPAFDVLEIAFGSGRLINLVTLQTAHFPHWLRLQYKTAAGDWDDMQLPSGAGAADYVVGDSVPRTINLKDKTHPQHYGESHWLPLTFRVNPVQTDGVRVLLSRPVKGAKYPAGVRGERVPYSLGLRDVQVGYRIFSKDEAPRYGDVVTDSAEFASTTDMLGSRVTFSLYEDDPANVLSPAANKVWRSDPQPVNFAVVNFYADVRDAMGNPQLIDRFGIDPLTVGAHANLYFSNDIPTGDFTASDQQLAYPIVQLHGTSATPEQFAPYPTAQMVSFDHVFPSYVDVDNSYLQWDPTRSWWFGMQIGARYLYPDGTTSDADVNYSDLTHPILSFGDNFLQTVPEGIRFVTEFGQEAEVPTDPLQDLGSVYKVVVIYNPEATPVDDTHYPPGLTLIYQLGELPPTTVTYAVSDLREHPSLIRLMGYPDEGNPGIPAQELYNFILKPVPARLDDVANYLADTVGYVQRPPFADQDSHSTDDSILRLDPSRSDAVLCPVGLIGGIGNIYGNLTWTPVARDYVLKKGYWNLPPTLARFFKFEFTNLIPETYENFVPIRRQVQVFTDTSVQAYQNLVTGNGSSTVDPGVVAAQDLTAVQQYADAISVLRGLTQQAAVHNPTETLYAPNLTDAAQLASSGWIWSFQPWHSGSGAPQFLQRTRHVYETVEVKHTSKVGYFAGIKSLQAYRISYLVADDTDQYLEHFYDQTHIESSSSVEFGETGATAIGSYAEIVSKQLPSTSNIRALQYATQQSEGMQLLPDDYFTATDYTQFWTPYGDAVLKSGYAQMEVHRGFFGLTYGDLEVDSAAAVGTVAAVYDDFIHGIGDVWANQYGTLSSASGTATLGAIEAHSGLATDIDAPLDFTDSAITVRTVTFPADPAVGEAGHTEAWFELIVADDEVDDRISIGKRADELVCSITTDGVADEITATFDPTQVFWQLSSYTEQNDSGSVTQIVWQTSADGQNWTVARQAPVPAWAITDMRVSIWAASVPDIAAPGSWVLRGVNEVVGAPSGHYGTYGALEAYTYSQLEGALPEGQAGGGIESVAVLPSNSGRVVAAARVTAPTTLKAPLRLSVMTPDGDLLASVERKVTAGETATLLAPYTVGSVQDALTYGDMEGQIYGSLDATAYGDHESIPITGSLIVRLDQVGGTQDNWTVQRLSLYDQPISWSFSADDGATWYEAFSVRNDPRGVFSFPAAGNQFRWRVRMYNAGASVSALAIRPWYQGRMRDVPANAGTAINGPNRSVVDEYPPIEKDPMWQQWSDPVPRSWYDAPPTPFTGTVPDTGSGAGGGDTPPPPPDGGGGTPPVQDTYTDAYSDTY